MRIYSINRNSVPDRKTAPRRLSAEKRDSAGESTLYRGNLRLEKMRRGASVNESDSEGTAQPTRGLLGYDTKRTFFFSPNLSEK